MLQFFLNAPQHPNKRSNVQGFESLCIEDTYKI